MSVDIRLKHSSTKDKAPVAADLKDGELALSIHPDSPAAYIKDSDGNIVKLAGADSVSSEDPDAVKKAGDVMSGQLGLPGGGGNTEALQKQEIETLISASGGGSYVELTGDDTVQVITGTGGLKTDGLLETGGGLDVLGGAGTVTNGFIGSAAGTQVQTYVDSTAVARATTGTGGLGGFSFGGTALKSDTMISVLAESVKNGIVTDLRVAADETATDITQGASFSLTGPTTGATAGTVNFYIAGLTQAFTNGDCEFSGTMYGYRVNASLGQLNKGGTVYGFASSLSETNKFGDLANTFNFYAAGTAPSYFNSNTYIGGSASNLGTSTNINLLSNGRGEFSGGVKVVGGSSDIENGLSSTNENNLSVITKNGEGTLLLNSKLIGAPVSAAATKLNIKDTITSGQAYAVGIGTDIQCDTAGKNIYNMLSDCSSDVSIPLSYRGFFARVNNAATKTIGAGGWTGFNANVVGDFDDCPLAYGFVSSISATAADEAFNFYASGSASNFFNSSTYIGGNTNLNTFELWKSTLTEEQLEQLKAGTLVAPANVSLPGDGEFARQWYYNQQSAEDQAALTAGTLEYPKHLIAAAFVDNFTLGDYTALDLLSDGTAKVKGLSFTKGGTNISSIGYKGLYYNASQACPILAGSAASDASVEVKALRVTPYAYDYATDKNLFLTTSTGIEVTPPSTNSGSNANGSVEDIRAINIIGAAAGNLAVGGGAYGLYISQPAGFGGNRFSYAIYTDTAAPSYFGGSVQFDSGLSIDGDDLEVGTNINVQGDIKVGGSLEVDNSITCHTVEVGTNINVQRDIKVGGSFEVDNSITCHTDLFVDKSLVVTNDVTVSGTTSLDILNVENELNIQDTDGLILYSPNQTRWRVKVSNAGVLSVEAA